ncbi:MAG: UDP-2,3-diacylglucosamine diphosphatase [Gammaproteobacteria bacterium RIFCSPHIGHO2_12_FULL_40_19]|nr:MAG: UDP-2,3-diacylglucosamine diphosphatase [Gammaproteobacteria bacterium RIFCSPHIGHO2_12_FULL_40_19]
MATLAASANQIAPSTLFISDLHLSAAEPQITNTFFYFLDHIATEADALYILGDFFESYIGDDDRSAFITSIANALAHFTKTGIPVFLMHGNRDFLIGKSFEKNSGVILIPDPTLITLYDQKILLMHGDSLCTDDKSHQRFRKITRNTCVQKIFLSLPISFRQKFAKQLRDDSMQYNQKKLSAMMDVNENAVDKALKKFQAMRLIHGHTHKPMLTEKRIVLDAWHNHGNYLKVNRNGKMELIDIPF